MKIFLLFSYSLLYIIQYKYTYNDIVEWTQTHRERENAVVVSLNRRFALCSTFLDLLHNVPKDDSIVKGRPITHDIISLFFSKFP